MDLITEKRLLGSTPAVPERAGGPGQQLPLTGVRGPFRREDEGGIGGEPDRAPQGREPQTCGWVGPVTTTGGTDGVAGQ